MAGRARINLDLEGELKDSLDDHVRKEAVRRGQRVTVAEWLRDAIREKMERETEAGPTTTK